MKSTINTSELQAEANEAAIALLEKTVADLRAGAAFVQTLTIDSRIEKIVTGPFTESPRVVHDIVGADYTLHIEVPR